MEHAKLDLKSRKILYALDMDARLPLSKIGRLVRLRKEVVNYRLRNLIEAGIVKGFYTVIDVTKLGYLSFRLFLKTQNMTLEKERELLSYLKKNPSVGWLVSCQGDWDLNMIYWAKDIYDFERFERELLEKYGRFIEDKWVSIFAKIYHFQRPYLPNAGMEKRRRQFVVGGQRGEYDEKDIAILEELAANARKPTIEIAGAVHLTPKMIRMRIRRMEQKGIIQGYRPMVDLELLGFEYYKAHFTLQNVTAARLDNLFNYCKSHPNVIYIDQMIGGADFEIEIQAKDNCELREITTKIRHLFADIIRDTSVLLYYYEHKFVYLPKQG